MQTDPFHNKRILVLDDDEAITEILTEYLSIGRFQVRAIQRSGDLFAAMADFDPHLVVIDFLLDGINGGELCHQLKISEKYSHIPVIIYSAFPKVLLSLGTYGCDEFIAKPFDLDVLSAKIKLLLSAKKSGSRGGKPALQKII